MKMEVWLINSKCVFLRGCALVFKLWYICVRTLGFFFSHHLCSFSSFAALNREKNRWAQVWAALFSSEFCGFVFLRQNLKDTSSSCMFLVPICSCKHKHLSDDIFFSFVYLLGSFPVSFHSSGEARLECHLIKMTFFRICTYLENYLFKKY